MKDRTGLALDAIWEETIGFVRAELALLAPLALLGFGLPALVTLLAVPTDLATTGRLVPGPWMLWFVPAGLVSMLGSLAVSALALRPGVSVRESIGVAFARLPAGLGLLLFYVGLQLVLIALLALVSLAEGAAPGQVGPVTVLINLVGIAFTIWLFVRLMPIWAVLSDRPQNPWAAVRGAFRLTRGCYAKLLLLRVVVMASAVAVMLVLLFPIGAVAQLLGMALGGPSVATLLSFVATGVVVAAICGLWTVFVARLYRRLDGSINGSIKGM